MPEGLAANDGSGEAVLSEGIAVQQPKDELDTGKRLAEQLRGRGFVKMNHPPERVRDREFTETSHPAVV